MSKFKWEHLTQKFAYDARIRKEKLKAELDQSRKEHEFYQMKSEQSKTVLGIKKRKQKQSERGGGKQKQGAEKDADNRA